MILFVFFFQAEDGIRDHCVTGVQTCALPISEAAAILLVIARAEPHQYERAAVRWLGRLCLERTRVDLDDLGRAAAALVALPERPDTARPALADVCRRAGQERAAAVFRG